MPARPIEYQHWRVGDTVQIGSRDRLLIIAAYHEPRGPTFALRDANDQHYRYAPPLPLYRIRSSHNLKA